MTIAILNVGTELTSGQILNRNAQWLSAQLQQLGLQTQLQLTIPDDRQIILDSLQFIASQSQEIIVTGGLGPTSDDFTRDIIAEWANLNLEFDESSWSSIVERLNARNYPVREVQKQQCFFPRGAKVLKNVNGTANGFQLKHKHLNLFVLPGPPPEIEGLWKSEMLQYYFNHSKTLNCKLTHSWDTIGMGESEVARLFEAALAGCSFQKAYRVHFPLVEVKLSFLSSQKQEAKEWIDKVNLALKSILVGQNGFDSALELCHFLDRFSRISFFDEFGSQLLLKRLATNWGFLIAKRKIDYFVHQPQLENADHLILSLAQGPANSAKAVVMFGSQQLEAELICPYSGPDQETRAVGYYSEMALITWLRLLKSLQV